MKKLALMILLTLPFSGYCQKEKYNLDEIPKRANKIIIANTLTAEKNYIYVGKILVQNGYGLKIANKDFGQFETEAKQMNRKKAWTAIFNVSVTDSLISITGQYTNGVSLSLSPGVKSEASYYKIEKLAKGLFDNTGIYEMTDFALKFGDNIKYINQ